MPISSPRHRPNKRAWTPKSGDVVCVITSKGSLACVGRIRVIDLVNTRDEDGRVEMQRVATVRYRDRGAWLTWRVQVEVLDGELPADGPWPRLRLADRELAEQYTKSETMAEAMDAEHRWRS
ncbi:MAG: hypothetical protein PSV22_19815 [Pseudolabrys sp.]|nr:hypothetical protein [Pseudolabrys sp.]